MRRKDPLCFGTPGFPSLLRLGFVSQRRFPQAGQRRGAPASHAGISLPFQLECGFRKDISRSNRASRASTKPRAQLRVLFPFLQLFTTLQVERALSLAETSALTSISFLWQPRCAGTKGEGETTRKEAQFLLLLLQHTHPSAPEGYLDQYPKQQKGSIISCWLTATI